MCHTVDLLARIIYRRAALHVALDATSPPTAHRWRRHLVGIAGVPGSGKSALAANLRGAIDEVAGREVTASVPMDGFHLSRAQLDARSDAGEAHRRRGAPWTFDPGAYLAALRTLRDGGLGTQTLPSFDHGVGDPVPDDIHVTPAYRIVLSEGNYLLLDVFPWNKLRSVFDTTVFLACDLDVAMMRVATRHGSTGLTEAQAWTRVTSNDRPNAVLVASTARHAHLLVPSLPWR